MARKHPRALALPHLYNYQIGTQAATVMFSAQPPVRVHWEMVTFSMEFICDANAANRNLRLEVGTVTTTQFAAVVVPNMTANVTYQIYFGRGDGFTSTTFVNNIITVPWPVGLLFANPSRIRTVVANVQAGDVLNWGRLYTLQWQDPLHRVY